MDMDLDLDLDLELKAVPEASLTSSGSMSQCLLTVKGEKGGSNSKALAQEEQLACRHILNQVLVLYHQKYHQQYLSFTRPWPPPWRL